VFRQLDDIRKLDRVREIPKTGLFCDLVWADPVDSKSGYCESFIKHNEARGCSYYFGSEMAKQFFERNKIISVIRAHEAQAEGFKMYKWSGAEKFPAVITIFSAPNYCDFYNNKGAVIKFEVFPPIFRTTRLTFSNLWKVLTPTSSPTL
jgi:serine/threonine-protein phosphatase 2B catalytic subunit